MGWYCCLEDRLKFPFKARCKSMSAVSPLRSRGRGQASWVWPRRRSVKSEVFVRVKWGGRNMAVPLSQLDRSTEDHSTKEAVG